MPKLVRIITYYKFMYVPGPNIDCFTLSKPPNLLVHKEKNTKNW